MAQSEERSKGGLTHLKQARQSVLDAVAHLSKEILGVEVYDAQVASLHSLDPLVRLFTGNLERDS